MGDSDLVKVGNQVIVVGAPYGLDHSLSVGWISHRWPPGTVYGSMPLAEFFQTDAAINTGNSGGPMFNMKGEVIGIVSHVISKSGGSEGLGFVVTINTARRILLERRSFWVGLDGTMLGPGVAEILNVPDGHGYLLKTVPKGSPAEALGLRGGTHAVTIDGKQIVVGGDVVLEIDGIPVRTAQDLTVIQERLSTLASQSVYTVKALRGGKVFMVTGRIP
jgi:S1-C subfamily serine protease